MEEIFTLPSFDGVGEYWSDEQLNFLENVNFVRQGVVHGEVRIVDGAVEEVIAAIKGRNLHVK